MNEMLDKFVVSVNGVGMPSTAIENLYIVESVDMPVPFLVLSLFATPELNSTSGVFIGGKVVVIMRTGSGDGADVEMHFEITHCREIPTGNANISIGISAIMCNVANIFAKKRRALVNMSSKEALETLYEEEPSLDEYFDMVNEDIVIGDKMTWLQVGTWYQMWYHILENSYVADDDSLLAFSGIDGDVVITTLKSAFSVKHPPKLEYGSIQNGDAHKDYDSPMVFDIMIRDTNRSSLFGNGMTAIHTMNMDKNEVSYIGLIGVDAFGVGKGKDQAVPIGGHLADGVYESMFGISNDSVHKDWAKAKAVNQRITAKFNGNFIMVTMPPHPNMRLGEVVEVVMSKRGTTEPEKKRYDGNWLVKRIMWDRTPNGIQAHITLARPTLKSTETDEKKVGK